MELDLFVLGLIMYSWPVYLPLLVTSNGSGAREHLVVVACDVLTPWSVVVFLVCACATVVPICNIKNT